MTKSEFGSDTDSDYSRRSGVGDGLNSEDLFTTSRSDPLLPSSDIDAPSGRRNELSEVLQSCGLDEGAFVQRVNDLFALHRQLLKGMLIMAIDGCR